MRDEVKGDDLLAETLLKIMENQQAKAEQIQHRQGFNGSCHLKGQKRKGRHQRIGQNMGKEDVKRCVPLRHRGEDIGLLADLQTLCANDTDQGHPFKE